MPPGPDASSPHGHSRRPAGRRLAVRAVPQGPTAHRPRHLPVTPPNPNNALAVAGGERQHELGLDRLEHRSGCRPGAIKVSYEIKSVSLQRQPAAGDGVPHAAERRAGRDFNTSHGCGNPKTAEMWDNFIGSPSVLLRVRSAAGRHRRTGGLQRVGQRLPAQDLERHRHRHRRRHAHRPRRRAATTPSRSPASRSPPTP